MLTIWTFLCRLSSYCYIGFGGYRLWSKIVQFFWERKFRDTQLSTFASLDLLAAFIGYGKLYKPDGWKSGGDAISSPQRMQAIFSGYVKADSDVDCDDFMSYEVNAIDKSLANGLMVQEGIRNPRCLTITWMEGWTGMGHNVCLLEYPQKVDGSVWYAYMDYGKPSNKCPDINAVVKLVREKYAKPGYVGLCWVAADRDFKPWLRHWG